MNTDYDIEQLDKMFPRRNKYENVIFANKETMKMYEDFFKALHPTIEHPYQPKGFHNAAHQSLHKLKNT